MILVWKVGPKLRGMGKSTSDYFLDEEEEEEGERKRAKRKKEKVSWC